MMAVFSMVVVLWLAIDRNAAPAGTSYSLAQKFSALKGVLPFLLLMTIVLGSLYAGIATPTEAGAVGVLGAVLISVLRGTFSLNEMLASLEEAALATSFLLLIAVGAAVFSFAVDFLAMPQALIAFMKALDLSSFGLFLAIVAVYLVLGMFVEPISMVLITLPVVLPVVLAAGWDPLWFGIILVMLVEIGMITPPVGMILYVLSGVSNGRATLGQIAAGAMPFVVAFLAMIFVFYAQPSDHHLPSRVDQMNTMAIRKIRHDIIDRWIDDECAAGRLDSGILSINIGGHAKYLRSFGFLDPARIAARRGRQPLLDCINDKAGDKRRCDDACRSAAGSNWMRQFPDT
jgi:tripartite ATP-independent transporter DctM subunit